MNPYFLVFFLIGSLIWLLPPVRQFGTKYFIFFLAMGLADIAGLAYTKYIDQSTNYVVYISVVIIAFFSILENFGSLKKLLLFAGALIISNTIFLFYPDILTGILILLFFHIAIVVVLLRELLKNFFNLRYINIFLAVLIFYEFTTFTKMGTIFTGFANNYIYFGTTTTIQILLGLFFTIFRYDYKRFILQLR
jgi:hypothetical protein